MKPLLKTKLKWSGLLIAASAVLIWRLIDFADEATRQGFQMTRGGLAIWGVEAEYLELAIILGSTLLVWKAVTRLARLYQTNSSG